MLREEFINFKNKIKLGKDNFQNISDQLLKIIKKKYSYIKDENNYQDLLNESITIILEEWTEKVNEESFIFNECLEVNDDNNRRIYGYITMLIHSVYVDMIRLVNKGDSKNLYDALKSVINELTKEEFLTSDNMKNIRLKKNKKPLQLNEVPYLPFSNIRTKSGDIDHNKLKELVKNIFLEDMEKYSVEYSNLLEIIKNCTGVGSDKTVYDEANINDDDSDSYSLIDSENPETEIISDEEFIKKSESFNIKWFERMEKSYKDDVEYFSKILFDRYHLGLGFVEIANRNLKHKKSSLQEKVIPGLEKVVKFENEIDLETPLAKYYLESFMLFLNEKFKFYDLNEEENNE